MMVTATMTDTSVLYVLKEKRMKYIQVAMRECAPKAKGSGVERGVEPERSDGFELEVCEGLRSNQRLTEGGKWVDELYGYGGELNGEQA